jgi:SMC interacting uncharacterized protein involved in chromosome segregation
MDNRGRSTLTTLVTIRKRRADNIRRALTLLDRQEMSLNANRTTLLEARGQLWTDWRTRAKLDAVHDQASLNNLKCELFKYHQHDQSLADKVATVDEQLNTLRQERDDKRDQLRKALVNHEKLNSLLE